MFILELDLSFAHGLGGYDILESNISSKFLGIRIYVNACWVFSYLLARLHY